MSLLQLTLLELYRFLCSQETHISPHTSHLTGKTWARKEKREFLSAQTSLTFLSLLYFILSNLSICQESQSRVLISDIIIPYRYHQLCQCSCWRCLLLFSRETFLFINTWNNKNYKTTPQSTIYSEPNKTFKCSSHESQIFYKLFMLSCFQW